MKIQIMSDIHMEFHRDYGDWFYKSLNSNDVDVLVIAGDLGLLHNLNNAFKMLCNVYPHVVYVLGNHEFYDSSIKRVFTTISRFIPKNLHILENEIVIINGQRFVGTTLWFPDSPQVQKNRENINDFRIIKGFDVWFNKANTIAVNFLKDNVEKGDVVITHHIPTWKGVHPKWAGSPINCFFLCDVEEIIISAKPKLWIYGHTHDSMDFVLGSTRLVCNPFGYFDVQENPGYSLKKVVEV